MLVVYVVTAAGIPLPGVRHAREAGELFPCITCGCGCESAERCWRSCCCHTLAQRLDWARRNGVCPPAFALDEAKRIGLDVRGLAAAHAPAGSRPSCCHSTKPAAKGCYAKQIAGARTSTVATKVCCATRGDATESVSSKSDFVAWRALACRGQSLHWLAAVPTLITVQVELSDQLPLVAWIGPATSDAANGVADVPAVPPPERA